MGGLQFAIRCQTMVRLWKKVLLTWVVFRVFRVIQAINRTRAILLKLPGPRVANWALLNSTIRRMLPEGDKVNQENVSIHLVNILMKLVLSEEQRDEGLFALWFLNPRYPFHSRAPVFVYDIDLIREILSTKNLAFSKGRAYEVTHPLIGDGVLSTSGETWAHQRVVLEKGFTRDLLQGHMKKAMALTASEHVEKWAKVAERNPSREVMLDPHEEMLLVTMDVLGRFAFSFDIGSVQAQTAKDAPLYTAFDNIIHIIHGRMRNPFQGFTKNLPLTSNFQLKASMKKLDDVVNNIIDSRTTSKGEVGQGRATDLLDIMLQSDLSKTEMIDNIKTILFAGHDTTAAAATWFIHLLAEHPETQERIRREAEENLDNFLEPNLEQLERLQFLNACVLEVLRLYPSAGFTRKPLKDLRIGKYLIPAGIEILLIPYLVHRNPKYYDDPDSFLPERWMNPDREELTLQAQLAIETRRRPFLPFSLSKRNCVGRPLSLIELRIVILHILAKFDLILPSEKEMPEFRPWPRINLTLNPQGHKVIYKLRKNRQEIIQ